jgi:hypothetical protein
MQILLAACTKEWVGGHSLEGITGSNPAEDMDVSCECCVLSGTGLCDGPITLPEESYRVWRLYLCVTSKQNFNVRVYENTR